MRIFQLHLMMKLFCAKQHCVFKNRVDSFQEETGFSLQEVTIQEDNTSTTTSYSSDRLNCLWIYLCRLPLSDLANN